MDRRTELSRFLAAARGLSWIAAYGPYQLGDNCVRLWNRNPIALREANVSSYQVGSHRTSARFASSLCYRPKSWDLRRPNSSASVFENYVIGKRLALHLRPASLRIDAAVFGLIALEVCHGIIK
jgi:hypothetical protein